MKIHIELDDALLRSAVENQVGATLSAFADKALQEKADDILEKKLSRFSAESVAEQRVRVLVDAAVNAELERVLGPAWNRGAKVREMLKDAIAVAVLKVVK